MGKKGGQARAARYDHATLSKWAKLGGRPRKDTQAQGEQGNSASSREDIKPLRAVLEKKNLEQARANRKKDEDGKLSVPKKGHRP